MNLQQGAPEVSSLSPAVGSVRGGFNVTVEGSGFQNVQPGCRIDGKGGLIYGFHDKVFPATFVSSTKVICSAAPALSVEGEVHLEVSNDIGATAPVWSSSKRIFNFVQLVDASIRLSLYTELESEASAVVKVSRSISSVPDTIASASSSNSVIGFANQRESMACPAGFPASCTAKSPPPPPRRRALCASDPRGQQDPAVTIQVMHGDTVLGQIEGAVADSETIHLVPFSLSPQANPDLFQPPFNDTLTVRVLVLSACGGDGAPTHVDRPVRLLRYTHKPTQTRMDRYTKMYAMGPDWRMQRVGHAYITSGHNRSDLRPYQTQTYRMMSQMGVEIVMSYLDVEEPTGWGPEGPTSAGWYFNEVAFHLDAAYAAGVKAAIDFSSLILNVYTPGRTADDDLPLPQQDDDLLSPGTGGAGRLLRGASDEIIGGVQGANTTYFWAMYERIVTTFKDHPGLGMWYISDDTVLNNPAQQHRAYALIRGLDPHHAVLSSVAGSGNAWEYQTDADEGFDGVGFDIPAYEMYTLDGDVAIQRYTVPANGWPMTHTPGWICTQGYLHAAHFTHREVIGEAATLQSFMSYMYGSQGLLVYAMWGRTKVQSAPVVEAIRRTSLQGVELSRQPFDVDKAANNNDLELAIEGSRVVPPGGVEPAVVLARESQDSSGCVLVRVINTERAPATFTLHSDRLAQIQSTLGPDVVVNVTVPLEMRLLKVNSTTGGNVSEAINGLGVRAYRFNCSWVAAGPNGTIFGYGSEPAPPAEQSPAAAGSLDLTQVELSSSAGQIQALSPEQRARAAPSFTIQDMRREEDRINEVATGVGVDSVATGDSPHDLSAPPPPGFNLNANPSMELWTEAGFPLLYSGKLFPANTNNGPQPVAISSMVTDARAAHTGVRSIRLAGPGPMRGARGERILPSLKGFTNSTDPSALYNVSVWVMRGALPLEHSLAGPGGFHFQFEPVGLRVEANSVPWVVLPQTREAAPAFQWVQLKADGVSFGPDFPGAPGVEMWISGAGRLWVDDFDIVFAGFQGD